MVFYSFVIFFVAALLFVFGKDIYFGRTELIHEYHQRNVRDKAAYGKAFGRAMFVMSAGLLLSSIIALAGFIRASVALLLIGLAAGIAMIIAVQIKYNGGIF